jgi:hypothetical protein
MLDPVLAVLGGARAFATSNPQRGDALQHDPDGS